MTTILFLFIKDLVIRIGENTSEPTDNAPTLKQLTYNNL